MNKLAKSQKQEKRVAKKIGGKTHARSGGMPNWKNDVSNKYFLVECKRTDKKQIIIKYKDIERLCENAYLHTDKYPLLNIEIQDKNYYLIDESTFHNLILMIEDNKKKEN